MPGLTKVAEIRAAESGPTCPGSADRCGCGAVGGEAEAFFLRGSWAGSAFAEPAVVDMPTMWAHNITNIGTDELLTVFWSNDIFDPRRPDTYPEKVTP